MIKFYILFMLLFIGISKNNAQTLNPEESAVKTTINNLFDGMRSSDSTLLRKAFAPKPIMQTIATREGKAIVRTESVDGFIKSVSAPHPEKYDERIVFTKILIDGNLASVWTDYKFFVGEKFSHCGVNSFQLFKGEDGWKIIYLIDTRRKDNCN